MTTAQYNVFISYARRDGSQMAGKLAKSLRESGMQVFWDQDSIPAGGNWEDAIDNALEQAVHILVVLTPFSVKSEEVTAEWRPMLSKGKNVLPLLCLPCEIPRRLTMRQYIDFQNDNDYLIALSELTQAINSFSGSDQAVLELSGEELLKRGSAYFESGQIEQSANDYLLALKDADKAIRKKAAIMVGKARNLNQLPKILQHIREEHDAEVKAELLDSVRKFVETSEWQTIVPDLLTQTEPFLHDKDIDVRCQAIRVLSYAQINEATPVVTEALLTDAAEKVRYQAALGLGRLKTAESTNALVKALADSSSEVRRAAARALGVHGSHQVIPTLKTIANSDKDREVRLAAGEAIENIQRGKW